MNSTIKVMVILGVISFSLGAIGGCKGKENGKHDVTVIGGVMDPAIYGRYQNKDDPGEYLDIRNDGAAYKTLGEAEFTEVKGTWMVFGDEIVLSSFPGAEIGQIVHDNSIFLGGKYWIKQEQTRILGINVSKDTCGLDSIPENKMIRVKCNNPLCKAEYEMSEKAYWEGIQERLYPAWSFSTPMPALICEKCGNTSICKAHKCGKEAQGRILGRIKRI